MQTLTVAELIAALQQFPQHLPVEIVNLHTVSLHPVDTVEVFDRSNPSFLEGSDWEAVLIKTETWAEEHI